MGMHEGRGTLARAMKDLLIRWSETRGVWQDAQARNFEEKTLAALEREVRTTTSAMDTMAQLIAQAKNDCRQ
jgi:hypothetical protein